MDKEKQMNTFFSNVKAIFLVKKKQKSLCHGCFCRIWFRSVVFLENFRGDCPEGSGGAVIHHWSCFEPTAEHHSTDSSPATDFFGTATAIGEGVVLYKDKKSRWVNSGATGQHEFENEARGLWHFFHDSLVWLLAKHFGFSFSKGPDCFTPTAQVCHWASTGSSCDHHVRPLAEEDEVTTPSTFCENHPKKMVRAFSLPLSTCKSGSQSCQLTEKKRGAATYGNYYYWDAAKWSHFSMVKWTNFGDLFICGNSPARCLLHLSHCECRNEHQLTGAQKNRTLFVYSCSSCMIGSS